MFTPILLTVRRPLLNISACCSITGKDARFLLAAIENGEILYAFDLSSAASRDREIRVFAGSLRDYVNRVRPSAASDTPERLRAVIGDFFPALERVVPASAFCRVAGCSSQHVTLLVRERHVKCLRPARRGPTHSARLDKASIIEFLVDRRIVP